MALDCVYEVWMVFKMARELIRKATLEDMPVLLEIYDRARKFMASCGNVNQWTNGYPSKDILADDIAKGEMYVFKMRMVFRRVLYFIVVLILVTTKSMMESG